MTQVYITPTHEQLNEFIKEDPLFLEKVKEKSYSLLFEKSSQYISYRLHNDAQHTFNKLLETHKNNFFKKEYGYISGFNTQIEKQLVEKMNVFFKDNLEKDLMTYLNSEAFKNSINHKIKEKMTKYVLDMLDEQIKEEAKKLIS